MNYERYEDLTVSSNYMEYEFVSVGPKGNIPKMIQFTSIENSVIVNLALGNKLHDGQLDDMARNDNKDRNKILATVVKVLKIFFEKYPDKWVFLTGSCPARTRLYRMAITLNYDELVVEFEIFGVLHNIGMLWVVPFGKGVNYFGFLVRYKNHKFVL